MEDALKWMSKMAKAKVDSIESANIQATAIYLLTRNGEVTTSRVVVFFKDGKVAETLVGMMPKAALKAKIAAHVA